MSRRKEIFDKILSESVEKTFVEILGENASKATFYHLGVKVSATNVKPFEDALERIFKSGANTLERRILENLYSTAGERFREKKGLKFADYVVAMKSGLRPVRH